MCMFFPEVHLILFVLLAPSMQAVKTSGSQRMRLFFLSPGLFLPSWYLNPITFECASSPGECGDLIASRISQKWNISATAFPKSTHTPSLSLFFFSSDSSILENLRAETFYSLPEPSSEPLFALFRYHLPSLQYGETTFYGGRAASKLTC